MVVDANTWSLQISTGGAGESVFPHGLSSADALGAHEMPLIEDILQL
jgi:hypothetical protein